MSKFEVKTKVQIKPIKKQLTTFLLNENVHRFDQLLESGKRVDPTLNTADLAKQLMEFALAHVDTTGTAAVGNQ
jgi:hypothetical protein